MFALKELVFFQFLDNPDINFQPKEEEVLNAEVKSTKKSKQ